MCARTNQKLHEIALGQDSAVTRVGTGEAQTGTHAPMHAESRDERAERDG